MADKEVGIVITARDQASKTIQKLAKGTKSLGSAFRKAGSIGASAFKGLTFAVTAMNQAFQLGKSAFEVIRNQLTRAIEKMREFRTTTDPAVVRLDRFIERIDSLSARIGDALLPVLFTLERVLSPIIDEFERGSRADPGKTARQFASALQGLVGVVDALLPALRVFNGAIRSLQIAFEVIKGVLLAFGSTLALAVLTPLGVVTGAIGELLSALGAGGIGGQLQETGRSLAGFTLDLATAAVDTVGNIQEIGTAWAESDRAIRGAATSTKNFLTETAVIALEESKKATTGALENIVRTDQAKDGALQRELGRIEALRTARREADLERQRLADEQLKRQTALAEQFSAAFTDSFFAVATGAKSLEQVMGEVLMGISRQLFQQAITQIVTAAFKGQADAISAHSFIPFIGQALGAAAGAAIFALISSTKSKIPKPKKMQAGGIVRGGTQGRDSVAALLTPGEFVLTVEETRQIRKALSRAGGSGGGFQGGGLVPAGGGAASINLSFNLQQLPDRIETRRWVRSNLVPALNDLGFRR